MVLAQGGLFPESAKPFVHAALVNDGVKGRKRVLDVGSGNGAWYNAFFSDLHTRVDVASAIRAMDMARQFPHATVLGIDVDPAQPA